MSESAVPAGMDMETILTRAVKKLFKWQLSGVTGTLIVASMLWFLVFFFFFLILVFVMCVEFHYDRRERQDAELALPKDNDKKWAETRASRETSKTSLKKVAPIPMPPLPVTKDEPKAVIIPDEPERDPEPTARQESPTTEAVTEESVIVDAPMDDVSATRSPSPPPAVEETPAAEEDPAPAEEENAENTQEEGGGDGGNDNNDPTEADPPPPEAEADAEPQPESQEADNAPAEEETGDGDNPDASTAPPEDDKSAPENANKEAGSPSKTSVRSKKGED